MISYYSIVCSNHGLNAPKIPITVYLERQQLKNMFCIIYSVEQSTENDEKVGNWMKIINKHI